LQEATNERLAGAEQQTRAALSQYEALAADQEQTLAQRLQDQGERIEREKLEAVNAINAKHFEETQRGSPENCRTWPASWSGKPQMN
jgi:hypothetical protein